MPKLRAPQPAHWLPAQLTRDPPQRGSKQCGGRHSLLVLLSSSQLNVAGRPVREIFFFKLILNGKIQEGFSSASPHQPKHPPLRVTKFILFQEAQQPVRRWEETPIKDLLGTTILSQTDDGLQILLENQVAFSSVKFQLQKTAFKTPANWEHFFKQNGRV